MDFCFFWYMYESFYGLKEKPFNLTPDPEFFFASKAHRQAMAYLTYGLREKKGFIQITGEVGTGKTTLVRNLLQNLDTTVKTAYIINPRADFNQLLYSILSDLEIPHISTDMLKSDLLDIFYHFLLEELDFNTHVVLIFDEAQNLSVSAMEEIRLLSNFETTKEKLLQIVFVGQPELRLLLKSPDLRQLRQRISVRFHLPPLGIQETEDYIRHRITKAGGERRDIFPHDVCALIAESSGGVPRLINIICDACLLMGYVEEQESLDVASVHSVVEEYLDEGGLTDQTDSIADKEEAKIQEGGVDPESRSMDAGTVIGIERRLDRIEDVLTCIRMEEKPVGDANQEELKEIGEQIQGLAKSIGAVQKTLKQAADATSTASQSLKENNAAQDPDDRLANIQWALARVEEKIIQNLEITGQPLQTLAGTMLSLIEEIRGKLDESGKGYAPTRDYEDKIVKKLELLVKRLGAMEKALEELQSPADGAIVRSDDSDGNPEVDVNRLTGLVGQVRHLSQHLAQTMERLDRKERDLENMMDEVSSQMSKLRKYLKMSLRDETLRMADRD